MPLSHLQNFYHGFFLEQPEGNNAFSYHERQLKRLYVPPLIEGGPDDLAIGRECVFCEVDEGVEHCQPGLKNFVHFCREGRHFFVFDNHNHAFFFWMAALKAGLITEGGPLLHVDQHSDMRDAPAPFPQPVSEDSFLQNAFAYTNRVLNVGNFIRPALERGLFSEVFIVNSSASFEREYGPIAVLDLDLDIFSPEMDYLDFDTRLTRIRQYIQQASFITIATSPFFIDQSRALEILELVLSSS
jgi:hypothetical protein